MLSQVAIGMGMIVLTTAIHAGAMVFALSALRMTHVERWGLANALARMTIVAALVLIMFLAALVEAALWAVPYLATGAISGVEPALYFSMVTFTTLGYGDVVLDDRWRLLATFEAATGIIMFGWTTALIVAAVHRAYFARQDAD